MNFLKELLRMDLLNPNLDTRQKWLLPKALKTVFRKAKQFFVTHCIVSRIN
jgi:hypothetical protein